MSVRAGYAGDLTPIEAMQKLEGNKSAVLIDVRTTGEWDMVGVPDLQAIGAEPVFLEWASAPTMQPNPHFVDAVEAELDRRQIGKDAPVLLLCRSGARSAAAASILTAHGFTDVYNVVGGFEGTSAQGRPGWKAQGLPWKQP